MLNGNSGAQPYGRLGSQSDMPRLMKQQDLAGFNNAGDTSGNIHYVAVTNLSQASNDSILASNETAKTKSFSWSLDLMGFGRLMGYNSSKGSINPDNGVANLDDYDYGLYIRPELHFQKNKWDISARPRVNLEYDHYNNKIATDIFIQKLVLKYQLGKSVYVKGGRYFKPLGTGLFINPSNPFFADPQKINPKIEPQPMDFVELNFSNKKNWNFSIIANVYRGEVEMFKEPFFDFYRKYGIQAEKYFNSSQLGFLTSVSENGAVDIGAYGQKTLNDAFIIWTDLGASYKTNRFYPVYGNYTNLIDHDMVSGSENKKFLFSGLAGISYSFKDGTTISAEYFYNGKAYSKNEKNIYNEMVHTASDYNFDITRELAKRNLGRAINNGIVYLNRNYVFTQIIKNDLFGKVNVAFRYFYDMDESGSQISSLIEWNVLDNLEVFSTVLKNFGSKSNAYKRLVNNQLMIGLIYRR